MRKRAGLARALGPRPPRSFSSTNRRPGSTRSAPPDFDELIHGLSRSLGLTVFLVTHDLDTLHAVCDPQSPFSRSARCLVTGTMQHMLTVDHPWVRAYFHGPRARAALDHCDLEGRRLGGNESQLRPDRAFALAGMAAILAAFPCGSRVCSWTSSFAYYDIRFSSRLRVLERRLRRAVQRSAGLAPSSVVRSVQTIATEPSRFRVEVDAKTPVRTDSVATIESLGVTGVSYVGIGPGTPEAPLLLEASGGDIPEIEAGRFDASGADGRSPRTRHRNAHGGARDR